MWPRVRRTALAMQRATLYEGCEDLARVVAPTAQNIAARRRVADTLSEVFRAARVIHGFRQERSAHAGTGDGSDSEG